jgi:hypothetical protein
MPNTGVMFLRNKLIIKTKDSKTKIFCLLPKQVPKNDYSQSPMLKISEIILEVTDFLHTERNVQSNYLDDKYERKCAPNTYTNILKYHMTANCSYLQHFYSPVKKSVTLTAMHVHLVLQTMVNCKQLHIGLQEFFHF